MKWTVLAKIEKTKRGQRLNEKEGNGCSTNFQTIKKNEWACRCWLGNEAFCSQLIDFRAETKKARRLLRKSFYWKDELGPL